VSLAAGLRLGPYQIQSAIGAGGMGEVWRAHDSRLDRDVALKVLPAAAATDETARARLVREARFASKLNHPHICKVYEVGEADAQVFLAMELIEGQPLSARLGDGPLPVADVLRYGQQMADALAHAHSRSVVHRDFKSSNVIITPEAQIKVLDFGLAKRLTGGELADVTTATQQSLTAPEMVAGTLAYMAPEQLRGHPADERSDIWALGVVLHEMATGVRPFQAQTGFELAAAILGRPAPPVPASVPVPLANVVERCLTKDPGERYQQSGEVKAALEAVASGHGVARRPAPRAAPKRRRWALGTAAASCGILLIAAALLALDVGRIRSRVTGGTSAAPARAIKLAVLPFVNASGSPEQEYLSDGLTLEMIAQLGRLHPETLSVIARTSVMRYKNKDTPLAQIGRDLGVDYVLKGSAQRTAGRVRLTAVLSKVADQTQLWADTYEHDLSGILTVQSELARSVAGALALKLLPAERARLASARTVNPEAYEAYLKGVPLWQTLRPANLDAAQRYFELALEKDPSYAAAYAGLAWVWQARNFPVRVASPTEAGPKARAAALQALGLDDTSAEAHEALATILSWSEWDWAGAQPEWQRALELNPNGANIHAYYAHYLANLGRAPQALPHSERAIELDPYNALYHAMHAVVLEYARRYDDSLAAAQAALSIQPDLGIAMGQFQNIYVLKGMRDEQLADQRMRIARDPERMAAFERGLAEGGYEGTQRGIADVLAARYRKRKQPATGSSDARGIAWRYLDAGDKGRALDWLYQAYEDRDLGLAYVGRPIWDPLRSDPRFRELLRRIGLPQ
jgi:eukaryotic-like serine/threonine-protein kinase